MLLITLTIALFYSRVPVSHESVTVSQHTQSQDTEIQASINHYPVTVTFIHICALISKSYIELQFSSLG